MVGITLRGEMLIAVGSAIWFFLRLLLTVIRKRKPDWRKEGAYFLAILYLLWLFGTTLFPIDITWVEEYRRQGMVNININPFDLVQMTKTAGIKITLKNVVGNVVLFVPLGIFVSILFRHRQLNYISVSLIGAALSLMIELLQFLEMIFGLTYGRIADINDILLNTCGILIGKYIYEQLLKDKIKCQK